MKTLMDVASEMDTEGSAKLESIREILRIRDQLEHGGFTAERANEFIRVCDECRAPTEEQLEALGEAILKQEEYRRLFLRVHKTIYPEVQE